MVEQAHPQEWSERIQRLLRQLKMTQSGLAERLGVSPATVSRWIQGKHEPTAQTWVALGNMARPPEGIYFWERAGMDLSRLTGANLRASSWSVPAGPDGIPVTQSEKIPEQMKVRAAAAIPLLNVVAWGDVVPPRQNISLSEAKVEEVILAPIDWCPHPENMIGMHVHGDSMVPLITPHSIIFVDCASTDRERLHQKLSVVSHRDLGFKVARLQHISGSDFLVSANYRYAPLDISNASKWKVLGEVLWWVSRDSEANFKTVSELPPRANP